MSWNTLSKHRFHFSTAPVFFRRNAAAPPSHLRRFIHIGCLVFLFSMGRAENVSTNQVVHFELTDQFNEAMTLKPPFEKPVIVTIADKQGSSELEEWIRPIQGEFGDDIEFFAVADLRSVPGLLRGMVRRGFKKEFTHPIALDWKGAAADQLSIAEDHANLFLLDRQGRLRLSVTGKAGEEQLAVVETATRELLNPTATPSAETGSSK